MSTRDRSRDKHHHSDSRDRERERDRSRDRYHSGDRYRRDRRDERHRTQTEDSGRHHGSSGSSRRATDEYDKGREERLGYRQQSSRKEDSSSYRKRSLERAEESDSRRRRRSRERADGRDHDREDEERQRAKRRMYNETKDEDRRSRRETETEEERLKRKQRHDDSRHSDVDSHRRTATPNEDRTHSTPLQTSVPLASRVESSPAIVSPLPAVSMPIPASATPKKRSLNPDTIGPRVKALYNQWKASEVFAFYCDFSCEISKCSTQSLTQQFQQSTRFGIESKRFVESLLSKSAEIRQVTFELGRKDADYFNYASQQVGILETRAELEADLEALAKESQVDHLSKQDQAALES